MLILSRKKLEKGLGIKFNKQTGCGIDTATKTGWATVDVQSTKVHIDYGVFDLSKVKGQTERYDLIFDFFDTFFKENLFDNIIIEEVFLGRNVRALNFLSRIGAVAYCASRYNQSSKPKFMLAVTARSKLGLPAGAKKLEVHKVFIEKTKINIPSEDIMDALILAFCSLIKEVDND